MNQSRYIALALQEASRSSLTDWRIGAVIARGGKVISSGYNRYSGKIDSLSRRYGLEIYSLHAEMDAIVKAEGHSLSGASMFISGFKDKNGNDIVCRPCNKCLKIIELVGIKIVYYTNRQYIESIRIR